jgi:hypothetical protein
MATNLRTTERTAMAQLLITAAGAGAKLKGYSGTRPTGLTAVGGGTTLHCMAVFGSTCGTATNGMLDFDEAGATQTPSGFTAGTPTFFDLTTSGDVVVGRQDVGSGGWAWAGTVAVNQPFTLSGLGWTMPGA